ncbi:protein kinase [Hoyosella sp. G463]|uniref:non-specific serine/threonine protein kinase n=1 Tax=Lolliginicoccus lacisalsi TaxID=2742202 RepID=A0A927JB01_9ACTN|nr:serine/threonine-protein kinase [Lolliginicoccus lacisalsi]MBD8505575.1 protein kinase [Lolliginicoccus lacisalsi]
MIAKNYRLVERIGSGGAGVVWRAIDERLERPVAVKEILVQPGLPESEREMLRHRAMREARNAARFQHPNAIVVFDIAEHEGNPCLVMEYFRSRSLAEVLSAEGTLPLPQVARIGRQVASALMSAHNAGIVHRDVKPGNVLINDAGLVKITDFGISKAAGDVTLTATGLVSGTVAYLPPEIARGAEPTPASDVFGLGATLFHALEGEPPYGRDQNPLAVLYKAASGEMAEPRRAGEATVLLRRMLASDPEQRPSLREARAELAGVAESNGARGAAAPQQGRRRGLIDAVRASVPAGVSAARSATTQLVPPAQSAPARPVRTDTAQAHTYPADTTPRRGDRATAMAPFVTDARPVPAARSGSRPVVFTGAVVIVLLMVLGLVYGIVTMSGGNVGSGAGTTSESAAPGLEQTPSSGGNVAWGAAGEVVARFYSNPAGSWSLLTPAAQQVYGDAAGFEAYWSSRVVQSFGQIEAYKRANNPDGSVDLRINGLAYDGQSRDLEVRVVDADGRLLIDSDTR